MIISKIEDHFGIKFKLNEVYDIENIGDLIKLTQSKVKL
jgi:acyl carrier protein